MICSVGPYLSHIEGPLPALPPSQVFIKLTDAQSAQVMTSPSVSPNLSRSPSALFSPTSPHRRSHPNLHHLSLAPLTPKYPISAADYDAYYDPATSDLHTSSSLSHIAALPSPGGILSKPGSRSASRTRRKNKIVQIQSSAPSGALTSEGFGAHIRQSNSRLQLHTNIDDGWLTQTALSLTEGTRESKGQLWIAKRDSSTSLHSPEARTPLRSGINTPSRSRRGSKARVSKRSLAMTPATAESEDIRPQWVEADVAAELEDHMAEELELDEDEFFRDRYGMVDFTTQFDSGDEKDVRDAFRKRGFLMGRWIDGVIDSLMMLEPELDPEVTQDAPKVGFAPEIASLSGESIEEPPERPRSVWEDVRWFGRVVGRTFSS